MRKSKTKSKHKGLQWPGRNCLGFFAERSIPSPRDYIFYDWDDTGAGDCTGWPEHVGIVVSVSGNSIKVIEGNKGNAVDYRTLAVNGRYIRGYGIPDYASKATGGGSSSSAGNQGSSSASGTL